jgi:hypothetical protein
MKVHKRMFMSDILWGDCCMTMNTNGDLILGKKATTVWYFWKIPIWKKTKRAYGTEQELGEMNHER